MAIANGIRKDDEHIVLTCWLCKGETAVAVAQLRPAAAESNFAHYGCCHCTRCIYADVNVIAAMLK
jgi:hypothetical protein